MTIKPEMTREERIAKRIEHARNYCEHYDPDGLYGIRLQKPTGLCKAGVKYHDIGPTCKDRPCIGGHERENPTSVCPLWSRRSMEYAVNRAEKAEAHMDKLRIVMAVVAEWRKKLPHGKKEVIECPACKGKLHLSQAANNGHVWGKCETPDCVSWME